LRKRTNSAAAMTSRRWRSRSRSERACWLHSSVMLSYLARAALGNIGTTSAAMAVRRTACRRERGWP
jgi:hypothetical protein